MPKFSAVGQCEKGSRWKEHVLTRANEGQHIAITARIKVDGKWVSDIDPTGAGNKIVLTTCTNDPLPEWSYTCEQKPNRIRRGCEEPTPEWISAKPCQQDCFDEGYPYSGDDCSQGWSPYKKTPFEGYICRVEEGVGGAVKLSASSDCSNTFLLRNPAIWCKACDPPLEELLESALVSNPLLPGRFFLAADTPGCQWHESDLVVSGGKVLRFEARVALVDNLPEAPTVLVDGTCVRRNFFNEATCRVLPKDGQTEQGCFMVCGSPDEVANDPVHGHLRQIVTSSQEQPYRMLDNSYGDKGSKDLGKSLTWTQLAMAANDQLRQRTAWGLSQIIVTAAFSLDSEMYLAFYDIFVRNAFGNLRDIYSHVTYSPVMGEYLTYIGSKSFDASGSFADENYAREVMQLFSIGLSMLHPNGSAVLDAHGEEVPTYSNEHIMNFARVFTGFNKVPMRANLERPMKNNMIDPMEMNHQKHDVYPKPDLYGGFLGDGYPMCRDLPKHAFLAKGARYEFIGYSYEGRAFELSEDSELFGALCLESGGTCAFAAVVTLSKKAKCTGAECAAGPMGVVKVGDGFYEYVKPPCVFTFFYNGKLVAAPEKFKASHCVDQLLPLAGGVCCAGGDSGTGIPCTNTATGSMTRNGHTCESAEQTWLQRDGTPQMSSKFCNKRSGWRSRRWCQLECFRLGLGYAGDDCDHYGEKLACSDPTEHVPFPAAKEACENAGLDICGVSKAACDASLYVWQGGDCNVSLQVHADGKVSAYTEHAENRFAVPWVGEAAPAGPYSATVEEKAVFTGNELPSKAQVMASLRMGAFAPKGAPAAEHGEVRAWGPTPMDPSTVFECEGKFFQNTLSLVHVQASGSTFSFRNPPAFILPGPLGLTGAQKTRAAVAEVESLLDHLFYHPNTATFIGRKLAQRFVTSNPSADYMTAISEAFRSGSYGGVTYGKYGSLGATVAAILLHPEARSPQSNYTGLLREPMLKLIHFLRSMEYRDSHDEDIAFKRLVNVIGQFPYQSPTVFNFFDAEFMPSRFASEPEPEPEPEPPRVGPEFEIFTPPLAIGLLNGMSNIMHDGVSGCDGFGITDAVPGCKRGTLEYSPSPGEEAVHELDLLLTGGRLTPLDADVVQGAYDAPPEGSPLQAAQKAILLTPEFHNLGEPNPSGTRPTPVPTPVHDAKDYKAVVMLFLAGGADTFHMLVPTGCPLYDQYREIRGLAAHEEGQLHSIKGNNARNCENFGLHPEMSYIADLYNNPNQKHGTTAPAAFVSNIGALVEPLTRFNYKRSTKQRCLGLFSHSHQQKAAQTLHCQVAGAVPKGVGGRMADVLASQYTVESFSISGTATWSEGFDTKMEIISGTDGVVRLSNYDVWGDVITNITRQRHGNVYCEEYAQAFADAIESSEALGTYVDDVELETAYKTDTGLQKQFHQVARLIKSRHPRKAERDFFFVQLGGWDHHTNLHEGFALKMAEVNAAIEGFVEELKMQQDFDKTVLVTASDFGRTLTFNGMGTDHGWGGNHMVIGGSIKGGQIFNDYPSSFDMATSEYITDRGRVVPLYPWENIMVPIAEWLGVKEHDISSVVFPNLGNFNRTELIIPCTSLFVEGACEQPAGA